MVRAKLVVGQSARSFRRGSGKAGVKRWNVTNLQGDCKDDRGWDELPESQCCFRAGRSCTGMIFTVHTCGEVVGALV